VPQVSNRNFRSQWFRIAHVCRTENRFTRVRNCPKELGILLLYWRARFITSSESTMNPSLSRSGRERLSRRKRTNRDWKSMWRPSSVSALFLYLELLLIPFRRYTAKAIDRYIHLREDAQQNGTPEIDPRLSAIIETIFSRCIADGEYKQVRASGCDLEVPGSLICLVPERQLASPSNHGDWISSNGSTSRRQMFPCCPMLWKP
jgi:hypothetical protein